MYKHQIPLAIFLVGIREINNFKDAYLAWEGGDWYLYSCSCSMITSNFIYLHQYPLKIKNLNLPFVGRKFFDFEKWMKRWDGLLIAEAQPLFLLKGMLLEKGCWE